MMHLLFLTKQDLKDKIDQFESILHEFPNEYWNQVNFLSELPGKWEYSVYALTPESSVGGYIIASDKNTHIHIHKFMIRKDLRGNGIGADLLNQLVHKCKTNNRKSLTLKVEYSNERAINFYRVNGFDDFVREGDYFLATMNL